MSDQKELLKSMLKDVISGNEEQASVTMHDYFVSKTREVSGLSTPEIQHDDIDQDQDLDNE